MIVLGWNDDIDAPVEGRCLSAKLQMNADPTRMSKNEVGSCVPARHEYVSDGKQIICVHYRDTGYVPANCPCLREQTEYVPVQPPSEVIS